MTNKMRIVKCVDCNKKIDSFFSYKFEGKYYCEQCMVPISYIQKLLDTNGKR